MKFIEDDEFFGFDIPDEEIDDFFTFKSRFKINDINNGFKIIMDKIYKRSLSKKNLEMLESLIESKFPLDINEVSGLELEGMKINKFYNGEFEISIYSIGIFDITLVSFE